MSKLPLGWSIATLGDLAEYLNGAAFKPADWHQTGKPIIRIQNLTDPSKPYNRTERQLGSKYLVDNGDILVSWSATLDAFIWDGEQSWLNQHIFKVTPFDGIDRWFLFYLLKHEILVLIETEHLHGTTMKHINRGPFLAHEITLPPLAEQRRIVAKLDALFARTRQAREELEHIPTLIEHYKQAILAAAFRGELTADWREQTEYEPASVLLERILNERRARWEAEQLDKFKAAGKKPPKNWQDKYQEPEAPDISNLPDLPDGWMWATVEQLIFDLRSGTSAVPQDHETSMPILRSSSVRPFSIDYNDVRFLEEKPGAENFLNYGDLLFTRLSGSIDYVGNCVQIRRDDVSHIIYPDRLFRAVPVNNLVGAFIEIYFNSPFVRDNIRQIVKSSAGHQRISQGDIKHQVIPFPPAEEQSEIAKRIDEAFEWLNIVLDEATSALRLLDHLDQANLAKAFRGELVPQDPDDEPASVLLERIREARAAGSNGKKRKKRG